MIDLMPFKTDIEKICQELYLQHKVDVVEERAIRNPFFKKAVNKDRVRVYRT